MSEDTLGYVTVFETTYRILAEIVKTALLGAGILFITKGEGTNASAVLGLWGPMGIFPTRILVHRRTEEKALEVIEGVVGLEENKHLGGR